ncbi:MAG: dockerin type I domain-containing protein, partial [Dehalococcoidia bacterium]|nr:dockerin type I domain-containing protein [Dehalococcoidia bacterium]
TAGSIIAGTGVFTAGTVAGAYNNVIVATSGAVTGNASLQITPDPVHHITISPSHPSLMVGGSLTFSATTYDQYSNVRSGDTVGWNVSGDLAAGSIFFSSGLFIAGTIAADYDNVILAFVPAVPGVYSLASVTVTPGPLASITVSPSQATLGITASQTFIAAGFDAFGNARTGDIFTWSVTNGNAGSIIAGTGVFTATSNIANVADYANVIVATSGAITGTASVNVVGGIIDGTVTLQGGSRPASKRIVNVTVKTFATGTSNTNLRAGTGALATFTATTVDTGSNNVTFQIVGLVPGSYDITIDSAHTLMNVKKNVVITGGNNAVNFGTLLEGDCDDSGQVAAVDFSILASSYLKSTGQTGYDARADFDGTGQVNSLDFSLLAANYLKSSPQTAP